MKAIGYRLHFAALSIAVIVLWFVEDLPIYIRISDGNFYFFVLIAVLHAASILVSLRVWKRNRLILGFCFIGSAAVWSVAAFVLTLWSSPVWVPFVKAAPSGHINFFLPYLIGSAIGASGYWLLVRVFWLKSLRRVDLLKTVALCVAATFLALCTCAVLRTGDEVAETMLTAAWWFAFSLSLYWSEASGEASKLSHAVQAMH